MWFGGEGEGGCGNYGVLGRIVAVCLGGCERVKSCGGIPGGLRGVPGWLKTLGHLRGLAVKVGDDWVKLGHLCGLVVKVSGDWVKLGHFGRESLSKKKQLRY